MAREQVRKVEVGDAWIEVVDNETIRVVVEGANGETHDGQTLFDEQMQEDLFWLVTGRERRHRQPSDAASKKKAGQTELDAAKA